MIKVSWEHWNSKEIENPSYADEENEEESLDFMDIYQDNRIDPFSSKIDSLEMVHTPFGSVPKISKLKPSDRWDCWLGYTNRDITYSIEKKISKIPGVESLAIMGRYTFCVGVGKLFEFSSVRKEIENELRK